MGKIKRYFWSPATSPLRKWREGRAGQDTQASYGCKPNIQINFCSHVKGKLHLLWLKMEPLLSAVASVLIWSHVLGRQAGIGILFGPDYDEQNMS